MADLKNVSARSLSILIFLLMAGVADARIAIRPHTDADSFTFHGNYSRVPFDPADSFTLEIWNCANGEMPIFIADRDPIIICGVDPETGFTLADLVYSVEVPADTCIDRSRSCSYRDPDIGSTNSGVSYFRVQYSTRGHGNRVWLESYGDLSAANQANMLVLININGRPRAIVQDTFTPLQGGGWFSQY